MANEFIIKNGVKINVIPDFLENIEYILIPETDGQIKRVDIQTFYDQTGIQFAVDTATEQAILSAAARDVAEAERILAEQARDLSESYSEISISATTVTLNYKNQAESSAILATQQAVLASEARNDAEVAKIEAEDFSDLALGYKTDAESAANTSTQQAILSAAARNDAENYKNIANSERLLAEDARDLAESYKTDAETYKTDAETASTIAFDQALLSSAARDGAEAERIVCEDIRDELQPYLREIRFDSVGTTSYYGKATKDSLETAEVWAITKIIDNDGIPTTTTAVNVAWTDRLTAIYS